jgi:hypothetical protein
MRPLSAAFLQSDESENMINMVINALAAGFLALSKVVRL